jgi:small subunit ribosomal protein S8
MRHDLISDALSIIKNAEIVGKLECVVPNSKFLRTIIAIMQKAGYVGESKESTRVIRLKLVGKINEIRTIRPRLAAAYDELEKFEKRYLPSCDVGLIIISTSQGVMSHKEAAQKKIGGRLLAYIY